MLYRSFVAGMTAAGMLFSTGVAAQPFSTEPFSDVPKTHDNYEAIEYLRQQNVLKGYQDGTFRPDARINRAEFVKLIANPFILDTERLNECVKQETDDNDTYVFFPDVRKDAWYAPEVCLTKIKKLIDGYPDGTFKPGQYTSFVESAKILVNTFSLQTEPEPGDEHWYEVYVRELDEENAIPSGIIRFDQTITRGQMAEMLFRLKTHRTDKPSSGYEDMR